MKVVIIGAGVAGLGLGWRLAQSGAGVTVLERSQPGSGATWASAGMIAVTAEMLDGHPAEIEFARYSNSLWPTFAAELEAASGRSAGYAHKGALILGDDALALDRLARQAGGASLVNAAQARALVPALGETVLGGLWSPEEALVDNRALTMALAIAFRKAGGRLVVNEAVVRIDHKNGRAAVAHTPFGLYHADVFVLAAGAWSALIESVPIAPVKGQMIALEAPAGEQPPGPVVWGNGIYAVPRGPYLLIGATAEEAGFDTSLTDSALHDLRVRAEALMPSLKGWSLADHWAGLRPKAPDGLPLIGPTSLPGLYVASGQYRNGILFAPALADNLAAQLLKDQAPIPAFDPRRFV